ncbi:MAG: fatty acid-binding protein DegV, partial [Luteimonas sp.]
MPKDYIQQHRIDILPITVRIDDATQVDYRDPSATLAFLHA